MTRRGGRSGQMAAKSCGKGWKSKRFQQELRVRGRPFAPRLLAVGSRTWKQAGAAVRLSTAPGLRLPTSEPCGELPTLRDRRPHDVAPDGRRAPPTATCHQVAA